MAELTPERRSEIMLTNIMERDCGVIALQALTGWSRRRAVQMLTQHGGYGDEKGTPRGGLEATLKAGGYTVRQVPQSDLYGQSVGTFWMDHERGSYLLYVAIRNSKGPTGHVVALKDGDLHNGKGTGMCPVLEATCVTR